ncbi:MAG: DUF4292 domain-containing protein [Thermodesulfobacteriota bacterium]
MKRSGNISSNLAAVLGLGFLLASACAPLEPRPTGVGPTAEEVLAGLRQRQALVQTFAGRGAIRIKDARAQHYFDIMIAAAQPDRLRLQAFDFMGRPLVTLTADRNEIRFLDYGRTRMYQGPPSPLNLSRFLPLDMTVSELITLLAGGRPLKTYERAVLEAGRGLGSKTWLLSLDRSGGGLVEKVWVTSGWRIQRVEVGPRGEEPSFRLEYDDYRPLAGREDEAPFRITASDMKRQSELVITYQEVKINPDLPPGLFTLIPPAGVKIEAFPGPDEGA